jgi:hypothetical protein
MTTPLTERPDLAGHELLQRLAGRIPDQALSDARRALADGRPDRVATLVAEAISGDQVPLTEQELAAVRELAGDPETLAGTRSFAVLPALPFAFSQVDQSGEARRDELDEAAVAAVQAHAVGLADLWRSWRYRLPDDFDDPTEPAAGTEPAAATEPAAGTALPAATEPAAAGAGTGAQAGATPGYRVYIA